MNKLIFGVVPMFLLQIPALMFTFIAYNILALINTDLINQVLFSFPLISGASFSVTVSDLLLAFGILFLTIEVIKATRTNTTSVVDHMLSMVVFVAFLIEFLTIPFAGTSTFFLLMLMALADVIAGFSVSIASARRDFGGSIVN